MNGEEAEKIIIYHLEQCSFSLVVVYDNEDTLITAGSHAFLYYSR